MGDDERDRTIGRLVVEHQECLRAARLIAERVLQISGSFTVLAFALDTKHGIDRCRRDFEICKDSPTFKEYVDVPRLEALLLEWRDLSQKQLDYEQRLKALGIIS